MFSNKRIFIILCTSMIAFLSLWTFPDAQADAKLGSPLPTPTPTSTSSKETQLALQYFSENNGIPMDKLHVGDPAVIQYSVTGKKIWQITVSNQDGDKVGIVSIDLNTETVVDGEVAKQAEQNANLEKYGKLEPELYDHLQVVGDNELVPVSIWLKVDIEQIRKEIVARYPEAKLVGFQPSAETDLKLYEKIYAEMVVTEQKAYQEQAAPILVELEQQGIKDAYVDKYAPVIGVQMCFFPVRSRSYIRHVG